MSKDYTQQQIIEAIKDSGSKISNIAKKLGCSWVTANAYVKKWAETKEAFESEEQKILDVCEATLYKSVQGGDTQAAKWILSTKGKKRGWGEKIELEHSGNVTIVDDIK
jgi:hypothetical protein